MSCRSRPESREGQRGVQESGAAVPFLPEIFGEVFFFSIFGEKKNQGCPAVDAGILCVHIGSIASSLAVLDKQLFELS